jgi:hypothetical protein
MCVCFVPTLSFWSDMAAPGGGYDDPILIERGKKMLPRARETTARAAVVGVQVAAGSDMFYNTPDGRTLADEIADLVASGLSSSPSTPARSTTCVLSRAFG